MRFGICAKVERAAELRAAGADFVEENIQAFLQGLIDDAEWQGTEIARGSVIADLGRQLLGAGRFENRRALRGF